MRNNLKPVTSRSSNQELLDEIEYLREKLAAVEATNISREERLNTLWGAIKIGFWEWDEIENRPIFLSPEMAANLGLSQQALYDKYHCEEDLFEYIHPHDLDHYRANISGGLRSKRGEAYIFDYRVIRPSGEVRHLRELEYGIQEEDGVITRSFGATQDITDQQIALLAVKSSEERYRSLFSQMPLGVEEEDYSTVKKMVDKLQQEGVENLKEYLLDHTQILHEMVVSIRVTNANQALLKIHGNSSLEDFIAGEEGVDVWLDEEWLEFYATEIEAFSGPDKIHKAELKETRMDDTPFTVRSVSSVAEGCEDTWERVITIHEDISERKMDEVALREAKREAEKASRAKTEFLSSMSHELRTPLNAILGFSQLFEYDQSLGDHQLSNAREINNAGKHLMGLIDEILDLSRIEAGKVELSMESVALMDAINTSVSWVSDLAKSREVSIRFTPDCSEGLMVRADAIRLKQVFLNLLSNAVKYNRQAGSVTIICTESDNDCVRIGIKDTGPGILNDRLDDLFQPFNRLGAEFSTTEGTGIGLVITKQLVELMHGELEVESVPGEGSTFTVQLPMIRSKKPGISDYRVEPESPDSASVTSFSVKPHILVVEDNPVNRELMAAQMQLLGYTADYAGNGVEALEQWRSGNYSLLLTDIRMPVMDGYELMGQIRAIEAGTRAMPIVAVTANAMQSDIKQCIDIGANDVLSKPFTLDELKRVLEKWSSQPVTLEPGTATAPQARNFAVSEAVDLSILRESVGDNNEVHRQLLGSYIDVLPGDLDDIQQAFGWRNHEQLRECAHKLKSSSGSMGATRLASICQTLELACREGREADISTSVPRLLQAAEAVITFVQAFCSGKRVVAVEESPVENDGDSAKSNLTVLLVDDDYIMHRVTTLILNDLGIDNVLTAMSGKRALQVLEDRQNVIDVVICDLNMPEMDGVEFTRHLAKQDYPGSLIFSSGEGIRILKTVEKLAIEHELQVLGVLEKPATPAKLLELLNNLDESRKQATLMKSRVYSRTDLSRAIEDGELDTYFQPKIDVKTQQITGVEALVRWNHPVDGVVNPYEFVPLMEKYNLIFELTQAVCQKALQHVAEWRAKGFNLDIAINISVEALKDLNWPDAIATQIEDSGLQPAMITFEVTESQLIEHLVIALDILSRLSLKKFKLSIDDFGTGYSSMEQLRRIPFSELKIDRAFVRGASGDASARAILESSISLAKKLDMKVVAEGVETEEDWNLVSELGCDQVQGYYISRPMRADQLYRWLRKWQMPKP